MCFQFSPCGNGFARETGDESCTACFDGPVALSKGHNSKQMMGSMGWICEDAVSHLQARGGVDVIQGT